MTCATRSKTPRRQGLSRSAFMEQWLDSSARSASERLLAAEVEAYYSTRMPEEKAEDEAIARASTAAALSLNAHRRAGI